MLEFSRAVGKAIYDDDVEALKQALLQAPSGFNINTHAIGGYDRTAFNNTCAYGKPKCAQFLRTHPDVDVNVRTNLSGGETPLISACWWNQLSIVKMLLADPRVNASLTDNHNCTALWTAISQYRHKDALEIIERLIVSGKDLGNVNQRGQSMQCSGTIPELLNIIVVGNGTYWGNVHPDLLSLRRNLQTLVEGFLQDPLGTRHKLRLKYNDDCCAYNEVDAVDLFALIIFLCDDLLRINNEAITTPGTTRFFLMIRKLPMELQMILCHRVYRSFKDGIPTHKSEPAFRQLTISISTTSSNPSVK